MNSNIKYNSQNNTLLINDFKPYNYNQKREGFSGEQFKNGIVLYLANLNTLKDEIERTQLLDGTRVERRVFGNEISINLMPDNVMENYSYRMNTVSPYGSIRPYYFYTSGNEKSISFQFTLIDDFIEAREGGDGTFYGEHITYKNDDVNYYSYDNLYQSLQNYKVLNMIVNMTKPIYELTVVNGEVIPQMKEPLIYFQLGNQFAGKGYLSASFTFKKPFDFEKGIYRVVDVNMTIVYVDEYKIYNENLIVADEEHLQWVEEYNKDNINAEYVNTILGYAKDGGLLNPYYTKWRESESEKLSNLAIDNFLIEYFDKGNLIKTNMANERIEKIFNIDNLLKDFQLISTSLTVEADGYTYSKKGEIANQQKIQDIKDEIELEMSNYKNLNLYDNVYGEDIYYRNETLEYIYNIFIRFLNAMVGTEIYYGKLDDRLRDIKGELSYISWENSKETLSMLLKDKIAGGSYGKLLQKLKDFYKKFFEDEDRDAIFRTDNILDLNVKMTFNDLLGYYNYAMNTSLTPQEFEDHIGSNNKIIIEYSDGVKKEIDFNPNLTFEVNTKDLIVGIVGRTSVYKSGTDTKSIYLNPLYTKSIILKMKNKKGDNDNFLYIYKDYGVFADKIKWLHNEIQTLLLIYILENIIPFDFVRNSIDRKLSIYVNTKYKKEDNTYKYKYYIEERDSEEDEYINTLLTNLKSKVDFYLFSYDILLGKEMN